MNADPEQSLRTLRALEGAPNYNRWLGTRLGAASGRRILEVGAGIGTITAQLAPGRERVIALEVEQAYVAQLRERFAATPNVAVHQGAVETLDVPALRAERLDTAVLSNVLEHFADDAAALRGIRSVLQPGGRLVLVVPALPWLYGTLDEAVGHHRRYTPRTLKAAIAAGGFRVERVEWMNPLAIPGWFINGRILRRRSLPELPLRLYDRLAPFLAELESKVRAPVGMSLFSVATVEAESR